MPSLLSVPPAVVAVGAFLVLLVAAEVGRALADRYAAGADEAHRSQAGAVQAAVLGLLGLLLAFSFSMALDRYEQRRALVVEESNAIGTTWLRTDALPGPDRAAMRADLRRYLDARFDWFDAQDDPERTKQVLAEDEALQRALWARAATAAAAAPSDHGRALLLETLNETIDLSASRLAAHQAHVPGSIVALLVGVSAVALGIVGANFGLFRGPHRSSSVLLALLVAAILYVILDLDQPWRGWIQVSQASLTDLQHVVEGAP